MKKFTIKERGFLPPSLVEDRRDGFVVIYKDIPIEQIKFSLYLAEKWIERFDSEEIKSLFSESEKTTFKNIKDALKELGRWLNEG